MEEAFTVRRMQAVRDHLLLDLNKLLYDRFFTVRCGSECRQTLELAYEYLQKADLAACRSANVAVRSHYVVLPRWCVEDEEDGVPLKDPDDGGEAADREPAKGMS